MGSIPESGRFPWRKKWLPTLVFLLEKFHGQRSLVGYSPWDRKELNVIEHVHTHTHTHTHTQLYMDSSNKMSGLIQSSFCFLGSNKGPLYFFFNLFFSFWLSCVLVATLWPSLVSASGGYSSLWCTCFSLCWLLSLWSMDFSSCVTWALLLCSTWRLPGPGIELMCLALAVRFLTTGPPGKSQYI